MREPRRDRRIRHAIRRLHNDESGQDLIEYALIALTAATGAVGSMSTLAGKIAAAVQGLAQSLSNL